MTTFLANSPKKSVYRFLFLNPCSQKTKNWDATNIELYVPTITPNIRTTKKSLKVDPPKSSIDNYTNKVVILVPRDLVIDSLIDLLMF